MVLVRPPCETAAEAWARASSIGSRARSSTRSETGPTSCGATLSPSAAAQCQPRRRTPPTQVRKNPRFSLNTVPSETTASGFDRRSHASSGERSGGRMHGVMKVNRGPNVSPLGCKARGNSTMSRSAALSKSCSGETSADSPISSRNPVASAKKRAIDSSVSDRDP